MSHPVSKFDPATIFHEFETLKPEKKELALKNLGPEDRATMMKVLQFMSGKSLEKPDVTALSNLRVSLQDIRKERPTISKIRKGIENILGMRISSKQLMSEYTLANTMQKGITGLQASTPQAQEMARGNLGKAAKAGQFKAYYYLAQLDLKQNRHDWYMEHLQKGAKSGDPHCQLELARNLIDSGELKEGENWLLKAGKQLPEEAKEEVVHLGNRYENAEDFSRANKLYKAAGDEKGIARMEEKRKELTEDALVDAGLMPPPISEANVNYLLQRSRALISEARTLSTTAQNLGTLDQALPLEQKAKQLAKQIDKVKEQAKHEVGDLPNDTYEKKILPNLAKAADVAKEAAASFKQTHETKQGLIEKFRQKELSDVQKEAERCVAELTDLTNEASALVASGKHSPKQEKQILAKAAQLAHIARNLPYVALHKAGYSTDQADPKVAPIFGHAVSAAQLEKAIKDLFS